MSTIAKRLKNFFKSKAGCGCGPKYNDVIEPDSKFNFPAENEENTSTVPAQCENYTRFRDSVAISKESDDPYNDFRQSMLQMIIEKEIYSRDDLQNLLQCFLELNAVKHHAVIVRAFMEIWNGGGEITKEKIIESREDINW